MTDPLRPFVNLVDSITRMKRVDRSSGLSTQRTGSANKRDSTENTHYSAVSLAERLSTRLSVIDKSDHKRRRRAFVEVALLSELGDQLAIDHGFSDLIEEVCTVISSDNTITETLDTLLDQFVK